MSDLGLMADCVPMSVALDVGTRVDARRHVRQPRHDVVRDLRKDREGGGQPRGAVQAEPGGLAASVLGHQYEARVDLVSSMPKIGEMRLFPYTTGPACPGSRLCHDALTL